MLLTPRPGISLDNLLKDLAFARSDLSSRVTGAGTAYRRVLALLEWAGQAARSLGYQVSEADLAALVLSHRYELMLSSFGTMASDEVEVRSVVNDLVTLEVEERSKALDTAVKTLEAERGRWSEAGVLVVPDSSFYIRHPHKLETVDFGSLLKLWEEHVTVLMPLVIVDELDGLKQHSKPHVRWRAGYTLAVIDRLFKGTRGPALLRERDDSPLKSGGIPRGRVNIELLFDSPGYVRLPINDDEIVDRAGAVQSLAERPVTMLTYDTGQSTRARNAGLEVMKLTEEIGPEPAVEDSRRRRGDGKPGDSPDGGASR